MSKAGRKKRQGVARYPSGRIVNSQRGETEREAKATVLAYRAKKVGADYASDPRASSELGRLAISGRVSEREHEAGERWLSLMARHMRNCDVPSPHPQAAGFAMVSRGLPCLPDEDPEKVRATANEAMRSMTALADCGRDALVAARELVIYDQRTDYWPPRTLDAAKRGLRALADFFKVDQALDAEPRISKMPKCN